MPLCRRSVDTSRNARLSAASGAPGALRQLVAQRAAAREDLVAHRLREIVAALQAREEYRPVAARFDQARLASWSR